MATVEDFPISKWINICKCPREDFPPTDKTLHIGKAKNLLAAENGDNFYIENEDLDDEHIESYTVIGKKALSINLKRDSF